MFRVESWITNAPCYVIVFKKSLHKFSSTSTRLALSCFSSEVRASEKIDSSSDGLYFEGFIFYEFLSEEVCLSDESASLQETI
jgi:hypothetical protein